MKSTAKEWFIHREKVPGASAETEMDQVKVLILGPRSLSWTGSSAGFKFFCSDHVPAPPSLKIFKELRSDIGEKRLHDSTLAEQGVLLLNACLTVPAGQANGHGQIWELFTDAASRWSMS